MHLEKDLEKYKELVRLHLADPLGGISEDDLNWLTAFEKRNSDYSEVSKTAEINDKLENLILRTAFNEGSESIGLGPGIPSEDERVNQELEKRAHKLSAELSSKVQPRPDEKREPQEGRESPLIPSSDVDKQSVHPSTVINKGLRVIVLLRLIRKKALMGTLVSLFLIISMVFFSKFVFKARPTVSVAASFTEIPFLEELMSDGIRHSEHLITVESPQNGINLKIARRDEDMSLLFEGG